MQPDEPIFVAGPHGAAQTFHADRECSRLGAAVSIREKEYQHRPLRSSPCSFCVDTDDESEDAPEIATDGGRVQDSDRKCARCDADAVPGSRFCFGHSKLLPDGGTESDQMLLANDCENPDRMGDATARATGLPELHGYEASYGQDGGLHRVDVRVTLAADDRTHTRRYTVVYGIDDEEATPRRIERPSRDDGRPVSIRTTLTVLLAGEEAVGRFDGVTSVTSVSELGKDIWNREPDHGYQPVGSSEDDVAEAVAEVSD